MDIVLQIVENVGTRHMKGVADYISKLDTEFRKIGFLRSILCNVCLLTNLRDLVKYFQLILKYLY